MNDEKHKVFSSAVKEMLSGSGLQALALSDGHVLGIHPDLDGYEIRFTIDRRPLLKTFIDHDVMEDDVRAADGLAAACSRARRSIAQDLRALAEKMDPK